MGLCNISLSGIRHPGFHTSQFSNKEALRKRGISWYESRKQRGSGYPCHPLSLFLSRWLDAHRSLKHAPRFVPIWRQIQEEWRWQLRNNKTQFSGYYLSCYGDKPLGTYGSMIVWAADFCSWLGWVGWVHLTVYIKHLTILAFGPLRPLRRNTMFAYEW